MSNIISSTLQEIVSNKKALISGPFGSNISAKFFVKQGIPVIRGNNLSLDPVKFIDDQFVFITDTKAKELNCFATYNDLIFTLAGTIGQVGLIPQESKYPLYTISNKQARARIDEKKVDPLFAYYWFSSPWMQKYLTRNNKGTTVPLLTLNELKKITIKYPQEIGIQKKIANTLDNLTQKISLNNSIISKLEEMAKTIYEYWFLQFDFPNHEGKPYASSGGAMKYSEELGREIPADWEVITLGTLLERNSSPFDYSSTQPTIDLSVMPQGSIMLNQLNSSNNFATNLFEMNEGDILFGSIRPYLKKAGIAPCNGVYAGTVYSYKPKNENDFNFAIITMCRDSFFDYAVQISQGTKMPVVKSENLMNYKLAYNPQISKQFNETLQLKKIICSKAQENQKLAQLRDWLLPMLMNGQVRVE